MSTASARAPRGRTARSPSPAVLARPTARPLLRVDTPALPAGQGLEVRLTVLPQPRAPRLRALEHRLVTLCAALDMVYTGNVATGTLLPRDDQPLEDALDLGDCLWLAHGLLDEPDVRTVGFTGLDRLGAGGTLVIDSGDAVSRAALLLHDRGRLTSAECIRCLGGSAALASPRA